MGGKLQCHCPCVKGPAEHSFGGGPRTITLLEFLDRGGLLAGSRIASWIQRAKHRVEGVEERATLVEEFRW